MFFYIHVSFQLWVVAVKIRFYWQEPELPLHLLRWFKHIIRVSVSPPCGDTPGILNRKEALGHAIGILYLGLQRLRMLISTRRSWITWLGKWMPGGCCSFCCNYSMFLYKWNKKMDGWSFVYQQWKGFFD